MWNLKEVGRKISNGRTEIRYKAALEQVGVPSDFHIYNDKHFTTLGYIFYELENGVLSQVREYQYQWEAHEKFFTELLRQYNKEFTRDMLVVCERFKCVYIKEGL